LFKRFFNRPRGTLADCSVCGSDCVYPVEWSPHDKDSWWMFLRCGECGASREATVPDWEAALYDRELDRAESRMRREADRLSHERLAEQAESFATALELDLIGAEDFTRPRSGA
jgi:transcription elongation factor Elf1